MLKKILVILAIISLTSCHGKAKKADLSQDDNFKVEDQANDSQAVAPYQTLDSEQQADAMNKETQAQEKEVEVQDRVFFTYDSSELSDEAKKILDTQVSWLKSDIGLSVIVEGHCDERGTREYNIALGERRANAAKNYLLKNGIESSRLKTVSYGKERPAYFGTTEDIMAKNRRAVTVVK